MQGHSKEQQHRTCWLSLERSRGQAQRRETRPDLSYSVLLINIPRYDGPTGNPAMRGPVAHPRLCGGLIRDIDRAAISYLMYNLYFYLVPW